MPSATLSIALCVVYAASALRIFSENPVIDDDRTAPIADAEQNSTAPFIPKRSSGSEGVSWMKFMDWVKSFRQPVGKDGKEQVIIMFGDYKYRDVVVNAMAQFHTLGITNYALICTDDELRAFMVEIGRPCHVEAVKGLGSLWGRRLHMLVNLLAEGTDVLMTDADAVWKKNPMQLMSGADIIASRGSYPREISRSLGATACMGFVYFNGDRAVADFIADEVIPRFHGDDQAALNYAFRDSRIDFGKERLAYTASSVTDKGIIPAKGNRRELTVDFLDHDSFPRRCGHSLQQAYVVHCMSKRDGHQASTRLESLQSHGLYWIKRNWESVEIHGDFESWIEAVKETELEDKQGKPQHKSRKSKVLDKITRHLYIEGEADIP